MVLALNNTEVLVKGAGHPFLSMVASGRFLMILKDKYIGKLVHICNCSDISPSNMGCPGPTRHHLFSKLLFNYTGILTTCFITKKIKYQKKLTNYANLGQPRKTTYFMCKT